MVCNKNHINRIIKLPKCGSKIIVRIKQSRQGFFRYRHLSRKKGPRPYPSTSTFLFFDLFASQFGTLWLWTELGLGLSEVVLYAFE